MVTAELSGCCGGRARAERLARRGLVRQLTKGYIGAWALLLVAAFTCAAVPAGRWLVHNLLGLPLHTRIRPAPPLTIDRVLGLFATNTRSTCWPLLLAGLGAWRFTSIRWLCHAAVAISAATNVISVGAALGVYGLRLAPYLPQLPFELYAVSSGAMCWWLCRDRTRARAQLVGVGCSILVALAVGAALESWAVPRR